MSWRAVCACAAIGALGCTPQATLPEDTFAPIRLGVVTSLSGGLGSDGPGWLDASRLAVLEANAAGGPLPGRRIELLVRDDETNSVNGQRIANELVDEGVIGIIGAAASSISLELIDVTTEARIPQLSCCSTSDTITMEAGARDPADRFFFRTIAPDLLQSAVVTIAVASAGSIDPNLSCDRLAVMHLDDDYGTPFAQAIEAGYTAEGGDVVLLQPFTDEQPSYSQQVQQVRDALGTDCATVDCCIALVAYPLSAGQIVRDWVSAGGSPDVKWIGTDGIRAPGFVTEIGDASLIDGFFGTSPITDANTPGYNAYVEHFRAVFGSNPIAYSSNQYDATSLLILAIARAGSTDGDAIRDALHEVASPPPNRGFIRAAQLVEGLRDVRSGNDIDYEGASGNVNFDEFGNVVSPFEIWRYDDETHEPCPGATPLAEGGSFCRIRTINAEEIMP
jgi:ABC-type branched-subunit amino acid transport system substrate-binding protein